MVLSRPALSGVYDTSALFIPDWRHFMDVRLVYLAKYLEKKLVFHKFSWIYTFVLFALVLGMGLNSYIFQTKSQEKNSFLD